MPQSPKLQIDKEGLEASHSCPDCLSGLWTLVLIWLISKWLVRHFWPSWSSACFLIALAHSGMILKQKEGAVVVVWAWAALSGSSKLRPACPIRTEWRIPLARLFQCRSAIDLKDYTKQLRFCLFQQVCRRRRRKRVKWIDCHWACPHRELRLNLSLGGLVVSKTVKELHREGSCTKSTIISLPVLFYGTDAWF